MDIGSVLLIAAVLLLVAWYVGRPFLAPAEALPGPVEAAGEPLDSQHEHDHSFLLAERDRVLNSLQELDFDNQLGKIPEEEYPAQRTALVVYGADILRRLDELDGAPGGGVDSPENRLEQDLADRSPNNGGANRANGAAVVSATVANPDEELEILLANRRRAQQDKTAGFCHNCGSPLHKSDKFCPKCGTKVG